ncbi:two-component response regulator ARR14-like [Andrographis paniculata]|uniref:two-component response regulator ARR14-like n=1 Tax=Andrographis paniculata TaxID=175694 RepID=UPI0021E75E21|nr:two-component response regulator ARR14-like [Andrographis paniculata]
MDYRIPFPVKVLVVDMDPTALDVLTSYLLKNNYLVCPCSSMQGMLQRLKNEKDFDLIICDADLPGLDVSKFLAYVATVMNLRVIMMSVNGSESKVIQMVDGICSFYYPKPIEENQARYLWQYAIGKQNQQQQQPKLVTEEQHGHEFVHAGPSPSSSSKRKRNDRELSSNEEIPYAESSSKREKRLWNDELHSKFCEAIQQLGGIDEATPKLIEKAMNIPGLTRQHISSHLQKYRLKLKAGKEATKKKHNHFERVLSSEMIQIQPQPQRAFQQEENRNAYSISENILSVTKIGLDGRPCSTTTTTMPMQQNSMNQRILYPYSSQMAPCNVWSDASPSYTKDDCPRLQLPTADNVSSDQPSCPVVQLPPAAYEAEAVTLDEIFSDDSATAGNRVNDSDVGEMIKELLNDPSDDENAVAAAASTQLVEQNTTMQMEVQQNSMNQSMYPYSSDILSDLPDHLVEEEACQKLMKELYKLL